MAIKRTKSFSGSSILYLVATPIGNLDEVSARFKDVLNEVDYIACEDSRNSGTLFKHFGIDKPLISCHEHNEEKAGEKIVGLLNEGKKVAYVSDAGYPAISDPGARLVKKAIEASIPVSVVNGPSASLCALVASGIDTSHYYFEGFLPSKDSERRKELESLKERKETIIFYESPHRIDKTLLSMSEVLGSDRQATIGRELTKLHEEFIRGTLGELATIDPTTLIGEMVIIVEGNKCVQKILDDEDIASLLKEECKLLPSKEAIVKVAKENAIPKNRVYSIYLSKIKNS